MDTVSQALAHLSAVGLGLMAGALLAEGGILVPFWRSATAEAFLAWYRRYASLLQVFFGRLEVAATLVAVAAATSGLVTRGADASILLVGSALGAIAVLAVFPIYFQKANAGFAAGTIPPGRLADELRRWSRWHWGRTFIAITAFAVALGGLYR